MAGGALTANCLRRDQPLRPFDERTQAGQFDARPDPQLGERVPQVGVHRAERRAGLFSLRSTVGCSYPGGGW